MRALVLCILLGWTAAAQAVLDCSKARTPVERVLCSSPRAALAEQRMALAFRSAFARAADREALRADQLRWQGAVRDACVDADCLVRVCDERVADLEDWR